MNELNRTIDQTAIKIFKLWPQSLQTALLAPWQKTLADDNQGLISRLPLELLNDCKIETTVAIKQYAVRLGTAGLFLWTAANLQDDLCDNHDAPKEYIPLANACLHSAWQLAAAESISGWQKYWPQALIAADNANLNECLYPSLIPKKILALSGKSSFLLAGPLALASAMQWPDDDLKKLNLALSHFLAAKQLADDVYDFQEDWNNGKRTYAHRGLLRLPNKTELPDYYSKQARMILNISAKAKRQLKTISALNNGDCLNKYLKTIESNCRRALTSLNRQAPPA